MSYIINNTRGQIVAVVGDGTINTTATDLALVGRAVTNYGEFQNENYVYLLENFANPASPPQPILGQLWYNSSTDVINTYNSANAWIALATQDYVQAAKISPDFTGVPTAPTATTGTNTTQIATTAFVQNEKSSPVFTGTPAAPTASVGTNNTQIATTAFVQLNKDSPAFTGTPTAPTAAANVANTQIATTAFVQTKIGALGTMSVQDAGAVAITGGTITGLSSAIPLASGGTGANTAVDARTNLGLGSMATQSSSNVQITGGTITGLSSALPLASGGTGSSTASGARTNLGLGSMATQVSNNIQITGGSILNTSIFNGTVTGLTNPLAVVDGGTGSSTASGARTNLGLASGATTTVGTMAVQNANAVTITGGTITGVSPIAVAAGGTGASTALGARNNLGITAVFDSLGTMSSQNANAVTITGGTITGVVMAVVAGGTGATDAASARTNLGAAAISSPTFTGTPAAPTAIAGTNTTQLATTSFVQTALTSLNSQLLAAISAIYPVGSIYSSTISTNPNTTLGFGTWTQFAAGRMMMGAGGAFSPGTTGGSTDSAVVSHNHTATSIVTDPGHFHSGGMQLFSNPLGQNASGAPNFINNVNTGTAVTGISVATSISTVGSSGTNANLPPYIVVYMWQRTA